MVYLLPFSSYIAGSKSVSARPSAAFDIVDHKLLISRLQCRVGVVDVALEWITSYLTGRSYSVVYGSFMSDAIQLECSVPQGSVLGPVLFLLYTAELSDLATDLGINIHMYADDTQLYIHCKPCDMSDAVSRLE